MWKYESKQTKISPLRLTAFLSATALELDLTPSQLCSYRCVPFPRHWKVFLRHILLEEAGHPFIQMWICSGSPPICIPPKKGYLSTWQKADFFYYYYYFKLRESFLHVDGICLQAAPLPGRDVVPQQPLATESEGAFSTPPQNTEAAKNNAPAAGWSRDQDTCLDPKTVA